MIDRSGCPAVAHGTDVTYRYHGCRCPDARIEHTRQFKLWRLRAQRAGGKLLRPSIGVQRRLQALGALGWPGTELAARLGITDEAVSQLRRGISQQVQPATYDRVVALYNELSMIPGPSAWTRSRAAKAGWAPPLAWDDDTIDDLDATPNYKGPEMGGRRDVDDAVVGRLLAGGRYTPSTKAERLTAVVELWRLGMGHRAIAERICRAEAVVSRDLKELREAGRLPARASGAVA